MNLKAVHYVILGLSLVVAACAWVATQFPMEASVANGIAGLCTQLMAVLGILSPQAGAPAKPSPAPTPSVLSGVAAATAAGAAALEATLAPAAPAQPPVKS